MANISLLGNTTRIEVPYIKVVIGDFIFGVYHKEEAKIKDSNGFFTAEKIVYPNYIKSLTVQKINGQVNEYTLNIVYPIRPGDDPNFFEKVFSKENKRRKIIFSYGDMANPAYVYRNEEALIVDVKSSIDFRTSVISYVVQAVSSATLGYTGCFTFNGGAELKKPSDEIKKLLRNPAYGLSDIFYGMSNADSVDALGLIPGDDKLVKLATKTNVSSLEYLNYLVSCMVPEGSVNDQNQQDTFYILTIHDEVTGETVYDEKVEILGGPYFKISRVSKEIKHSEAYEIDLGYPSANVICNFNIDDNENYSIYYDWQKEINDQEYVTRLDDNGQLIEIYSPQISSKNDTYETRQSDKIWYSKLTQYPISATITIKGLLRPATLMQYVKLNVLFYGKKHISSGIYIVTKQIDQIDQNGFRTTLGITRISGDDDYGD